MKTVKTASEDHVCASALRSAISEIFDLPQPDQVVLTPGILVGLNILMGGLHVNNIALSAYEYYDEYHFPNRKTESLDVDAGIDDIQRSSPDIAIISLVTWRGKSLPVNQMFRRIRAAFSRNSPLLIADCAHAGAIGFPSLNEIEADIICGDICKWITPSDWQRNLAFFWFREPALWQKAAQTFRPYYLATHQERSHLLARWIDPYEVKTVVSWLTESGLNRNRLLCRHERNMELACLLSDKFGLSESPESSILWINNESASNTALRELEQSGLAWSPPDGGVRILCRAEEQPTQSLIASLDAQQAHNPSDPLVGCV